ncbi:TadE family type IV pilus minor pilin [Cellulomonas sp. HZM]|uniref:TadE family type IV pilus minor pilin n=1 Tax=Cellulomonas sp. HZM TaxID=1454010 RepID=UPI00049376B4|nr:TadE family type IV pilus minor pilin [Cellulomonas sp. HZM]
MRTRAGGRGGDERGSVTAELAIGFPVVVLALVAALGVVAAGSAQLRCADAARAGARLAALGQAGDVVSSAQRLAGEGASVTVADDGSWTTVTVRRAVPGVGWLGGLDASASASARVEP